MIVVQLNEVNIQIAGCQCDCDFTQKQLQYILKSTHEILKFCQQDVRVTNVFQTICKIL